MKKNEFAFLVAELSQGLIIGRGYGERVLDCCPICNDERVYSFESGKQVHHSRLELIFKKYGFSQEELKVIYVSGQKCVSLEKLLVALSESTTLV